MARIPSTIPSRRIARWSTALLVGCLSLARAKAAAADNAQQAILLFEEGKKLSEQGKWADACPKFAEAHRLKADAIGITLNLGDCYKHVGKTASAYSAFREAEFLAKKQNDADREKFAHGEAASLEPKLSKLQINAKQTPGLIIHNDGQEIGPGSLGAPLPIDPGEHKIEATAPGYRVWSTVVKIGDTRDMQTLEIPLLQKDETAGAGAGAGGPNTGMRTASFVVGGVGAAGLVLGGVMGGLAMSDASKLKTLCGDKKQCPPGEAQDTRASANTKALVSTVGLIGGAALLGTGVVLFVVSRGGSKPPADEAPKAARVIPTVSPTSAGLTVLGSF